MFSAAVFLLEGAKELFGFLKQKSVLKRKIEIATLENKSRLALAKESHNSAWETAQLGDKDKLLRIAAFILFSSTLWSNFISPELGQRVANAWHLVPLWQANVLSGMCLAVFGMKQLPNFVGAVVGNIAQSLKNNGKR